MKLQQKQIQTTVLGIVIFIFSLFLFLSTIPESPLIHSDAVRHLILAKDCVNHNVCHLRASPDTGSILGISHGAVFLHFITFVHFLGGDIKTCIVIIAFCNALAVTLLYFIAATMVNIQTSLAAAIIYLSMIYIREGQALLWNPAILHLPSVLFLFSSLHYIKSKKLIYFIVSAFILSLGIQIHLLFLIHSLGFLYLIFLTPKEKRLDAVLLGMVIIIGFIIIASLSIFQNIFFPSNLNNEPSIRSYPFIFVSVIVGSIIMLNYYFNWRKKKVIEHITLFLLVDYWLCWILLSFQRDFEHRYYYSLLPGISLLIAQSISLLHIYLTKKLENKKYLKVIPIIPVIAAFLIAAMPFAQNILLFIVHRHVYADIENYSFTMDDAKIIEGFLYNDRNYSYDEIFRHLRGGENYWQLLNGLGYYYPIRNPNKIQDNKNKLDFSIFKSSIPKAGNLPAGNWIVLKRNKKYAITIYQYKPYLKLDKFKACFVTREKSLCEWEEIKYSFVPKGNPKLYTSRLLFDIPQLIRQLPSFFSLFIKVPIYVAANQPPRIIFIPYMDNIKKCSGFIEQVKGVNYEGKLPANMVTIISEKKSRMGEISFSWKFDNNSCSGYTYHSILPAILEISKENLKYYIKLNGSIIKTYYNQKNEEIHFKDKEANNRYSQLFSYPKVITKPLRYVISIMFFIAFCVVASITICLSEIF